MRFLKIILIALIVVALAFTVAFAAGNVAKGKALFNDQKFGDGTSGKSCNTCHPNGQGLEKAGAKKEFNIMGQKQNSLEAAVNFCIVNPLKGKAIDIKSKQMTDIVAYIKSLKTIKKKAAGY